MSNNNYESFFEDDISETELESRVASAKAILPNIPELEIHAETFLILYKRYRKLMGKKYILEASVDNIE